MKIISDMITTQELQQMAKVSFGNMVKAVVDIDKGIIAIDGELHADLEALLVQHGSLSENIWGINIYPDLKDFKFIDFESMLNVRPLQNNPGRTIQDEVIKDKIRHIISRLVVR